MAELNGTFLFSDWQSSKQFIELFVYFYNVEVALNLGLSDKPDSPHVSGEVSKSKNTAVGKHHEGQDELDFFNVGIDDQCQRIRAEFSL